MEVLVILGTIAWLLAESLLRRRKEAVLEAEVAALRRELAGLREAQAGSPPRSAPVAQAKALPGPPPPAPAAPGRGGLDDTLPVVVPAWIRELPAAPAPAVPPPPVPAQPPAPAPAHAFDWESLVGVKLFSYVAGVALLVAAVAFLRYGVDHGWLGPPARMAVGIAAGLLLLAGCETRAARSYPATAQAFTAAGLATLFATFYASAALWNLVHPAAAFAFMALTTALAAWLAIRRDSAFVAVLGLLGGFAAPLLLSAGEDRPLGLFGYLGLLNIGLAWVSARRRWPLLLGLSVALTALFQAGWAASFLTEAKVGTGIGVFLLFPLLAFGGLLAAGAGASGKGLRWAACIAAFPPLLFALRLALDPVYGKHFALMFGFLFLVDAGLAAVALVRGPGWLHALGACGTLAVFAAWMASSFTPEAWPVLPALLVLFTALYLGAPWLRDRLGLAPGGPGGLAVHAGPLLMAAFPALVFMEPAAADPLAFFPWVLAPLLLAAAHAVWSLKPAPYLLAVLSALLTELFWTWRHLDGARCGAALGVQGMFSLAFLGTAVLAGLRGRRQGRELAWPAWASLAGLSGAALLLPVAADPLLASPPWPMLAALGGSALAVLACARALGKGLPLAAFAPLGQGVLLAWVLGGAAPGLSAPGAAAAVLALQALVWAGFEMGRGSRGFAFAAGAGALAGQGVLAALLAQGARDAGILIPAQSMLVVLVLLLARRTRRQGWFIAQVACTALLLALLSDPLTSRLDAGGLLRAALPPYLLQLLHPLFLDEAQARGRLPWLGAALASGVFFLAARAALMGLAPADRVIGALPLAQAALLAPHALRLRRLAGRSALEGPSLGSLALVAGTILALVTVAVPLQLEKEWITLGWALLGAALAWLSRRIPHSGIPAWGGGLFAAVFLRLALNPSVLAYHPRSGQLGFNWYLYTYLVPALACFLASRLLAGVPLASRALRRLLSAEGAVLLFLLLNIEIADAFSEGPALTFNLLHGSLAQDLSYTIGWAIFAILMLVAGVVLASRTTRAAAILLLAATVFKAFLHDLSRLSGLYRVASFVGLAICLAGVAVILQRFVLRKPSDEGREDPVAHKHPPEAEPHPGAIPQ